MLPSQANTTADTNLGVVYCSAPAFNVLALNLMYSYEGVDPVTS